MHCLKRTKRCRRDLLVASPIKFQLKKFPYLEFISKQGLFDWPSDGTPKPHQEKTEDPDENANFCYAFRLLLYFSTVLPRFYYNHRLSSCGMSHRKKGPPKSSPTLSTLAGREAGIEESYTSGRTTDPNMRQGCPSMVCVRASLELGRPVNIEEICKFTPSNQEVIPKI